jgi:hypothetical protein
MFARGVPGEGRSFLCFFAFLLTFLFASCASHQSNNEPPQPGSGVAEYKQLTKEALAGLQVALDSLNKVVAQPNPCPPKVMAAFSDAVHRLQVDSLRIRARAQAIQTRGDAYFADWSASLAQIKNVQVRQAAERHRPELQQSFNNIKAASQQAGSAFKPFLHGLRMLHVQLEKQSGLTQDDATRDLIHTTRENGAEVVRQLAAVQEELDNISRMLRTKS